MRTYVDGDEHDAWIPLVLGMKNMASVERQKPEEHLHAINDTTLLSPRGSSRLALEASRLTPTPSRLDPTDVRFAANINMEETNATETKLTSTYATTDNITVSSSSSEGGQVSCQVDRRKDTAGLIDHNIFQNTNGSTRIAPTASTRGGYRYLRDATSAFPKLRRSVLLYFATIQRARPRKTHNQHGSPRTPSYSSAVTLLAR